MPEAPTEDENKQVAEEKEAEPEKKLNFSYVECLLYMFHQLGKQVMSCK